MTNMLHSAQKVGTVHIIDIIGAGSRYPFGVDIGFIDPDRSNGAALTISEWDRSYSKDTEKLARKADGSSENPTAARQDDIKIQEEAVRA